VKLTLILAILLIKVRSILKKKAKEAPEFVARTEARLAKRSQESARGRSKTLSESSSDSGSDTGSSSSSSSEAISLTAPDLLSLVEPATQFRFRLLEKNIKAMEVDRETGEVNTVRIEVVNGLI